MNLDRVTNTTTCLTFLHRLYPDLTDAEPSSGPCGYGGPRLNCSFNLLAVTCLLKESRRP